jgi:hypothetical protein
MAEVQKTLARAQASLDNLDRNVTDPGAPVQQNLQETLLELQRTARALRVLGRLPAAASGIDPARQASGQADPAALSLSTMMRKPRSLTAVACAALVALVALGACSTSSPPTRLHSLMPAGADAARRDRLGARSALRRLRADPRAGAGRPAAVAGAPA